MAGLQHSKSLICRRDDHTAELHGDRSREGEQPGWTGISPYRFLGGASSIRCGSAGHEDLRSIISSGYEVRQATSNTSHGSGMLRCMTDPQFGPTPGEGSTPPPYSGYPPPGQYPPPPAAYYDPSAPYGRHPVTGAPLSEKSKVVAGLLQLIGLVGIVGIGRIYLGYTGLGIAQLVVGVVTCGLGAVVWGIVDAVMILTDKVRDPQGRPLRDGT